MPFRFPGGTAKQFVCTTSLGVIGVCWRCTVPWLAVVQINFPSYPYPLDCCCPFSSSSAVTVDELSVSAQQKISCFPVCDRTVPVLWVATIELGGLDSRCQLLCHTLTWWSALCDILFPTPIQIEWREPLKMVAKYTESRGSGDSAIIHSRICIES